VLDPAGPFARLAVAGVVDGAFEAVAAGVAGAVADALGEAEVTGELEVLGGTDGPAEAEVLGAPEVVEGAGEVADADGDAEADAVELACPSPIRSGRACTAFATPVAAGLALCCPVPGWLAPSWSAPASESTLPLYPNQRATTAPLGKLGTTGAWAGWVPASTTSGS
jgi:hypothetical protein